jgi:DNA-binding transcriptional MerR regulator
LAERYSAKEVAAALEISPSTLGKYVMALEGAGFRFETGKRNARLFDEKELVTLRRMIEIASSEQLPPGQAANLIGQNAFFSIIDSRLCALEEQQAHLLALHKELSEKIARLPVQRIPDYTPPPFLSFPRRKAGFLNFLSK